jgi:putative ABC transport system ATP-binding protein
MSTRSGMTAQPPGAYQAWLDFSAAGAGQAEEIDEAVIAVLEAVDLSESVYRLGLGRRLDPADEKALAPRIIAVRRALNQALAEDNASNLIEPLDPQRFNRNATLGENLLFGVMRDPKADEEALFSDPDLRAVLDSEGLIEALTEVGTRIASTMVEIFEGVSSDHFLFERFSFIAAEELPQFKEILSRSKPGRTSTPPPSDAARLIGLALSYIEPRHRLGLVTPDLMARIVRARKALRDRLPAALALAVEFYDPARTCVAAPLRDNFLFGRIDQTVAGATERVMATLHQVLRSTGLEREVYRIGLGFPVGPGGRLLPPTQRLAVALARCLIKRPDILVLDELLGLFGEVEGRAILDRVRARMEGRTVIAAMRDAETAATMDACLSFTGGRMRQPVAPVAGVEAPQAGPEQAEIEALRAVPMFATIDTARLKLIAFTSERISFEEGQILFRQGDPSDAAYIILEGAADVFLETASDRLYLATIGAHSIVGEMGVVSGAGRSATVVAAGTVSAIRLSRDVVLGLIGEFPQIALAMLRDQIKRIVSADARLARASGLKPRPQRHEEA